MAEKLQSQSRVAIYTKCKANGSVPVRLRFHVIRVPALGRASTAHLVSRLSPACAKTFVGELARLKGNGPLVQRRKVLLTSLAKIFYLP